MAGHPTITEESIPEVDVLAIGDTTLSTSAPVGLGPQGAIGLSDKRIIVSTTWDLRTLESTPNFKGLCSWNREHRMG